jgi:hypothetical protein
VKLLQQEIKTMSASCVLTVNLRQGLCEDRQVLNVRLLLGPEDADVLLCPSKDLQR